MKRTPKPVAVWPVVLLALPAFVAVWSGWVGLGELTGFGTVRPLPGIADGFTLNSAITLPIGMEVYASYALYVWLSGRGNDRARRFARASAIASLIVGAAGQIAYHLMSAAGMTAAPWWITMLVACCPVAVLGMGAALAHLVRGTHAEPEGVPAVDVAPPVKPEPAMIEPEPVTTDDTPGSHGREAAPEPVKPEPEPVTTEPAQADRALPERGKTEPEGVPLVESLPPTEPEPAMIEPANGETEPIARPPAIDLREAAREAYRRSVLEGAPLSGAELGRRFGRSDRWGLARVHEVRAEISTVNGHLPAETP